VHTPLKGKRLGEKIGGAFETGVDVQERWGRRRSYAVRDAINSSEKRNTPKKRKEKFALKASGLKGGM